jgi:ATP-dependent RNA helicase DHX36
LQVSVICGETGCGKTTQVPQMLLDAALAHQGEVAHIVCTQPRRLSAIAVAERVALERGETLGWSVGYQVTFLMGVENQHSVSLSLSWPT